MLPTKPLPRLALTLTVLLLLLPGCASNSPPTSPQVVECPKIPALPPQAQQPALPSWCSPTCSAGLTKLRESWQQQLTSPTPPAGPASASTAR